MNFRSSSETRKPLTMFTQSSLTDIVLLLLIFFLLTSSFVTNLGIKVTIPKAETGAPNTGTSITVTVTKEGVFYVDEKRVPSASLAPEMRLRLDSGRKTSVILRADKDARVDDAVKVMNISKALNLTVLMATERSQ